MLELFGINPERVQVSWISAAQGQKFADTAKELVEKAKELGPIKKLARNYKASWISDFPEDFAQACEDCASCPSHSPQEEEANS